MDLAYIPTSWTSSPITVPLTLSILGLPAVPGTHWAHSGPRAFAFVVYAPERLSTHIVDEIVVLLYPGSEWTDLDYSLRKSNHLPHNSNPVTCFTFLNSTQPTLVLLPGKSHEQRSLVGYSPWRHKESDTTKWLHFFFFIFTWNYIIQFFMFLFIVSSTPVLKFHQAKISLSWSLFYPGA